MPKSKHTQPIWRRHLRDLMEKKGFNPRRLSLAAGLNPTGVRDMLEGRTMSPRYDTARALAYALGTTPAILMGDDDLVNEIKQKGPKFGDDVELFTEVIARLQKAIEDYKRDINPKRQIEPQNFAAMAATMFHQVKGATNPNKALSTIKPKVHDLLNYETLRGSRRRHG